MTSRKQCAGVSLAVFLGPLGCVQTSGKSLLGAMDGPQAAASTGHSKTQKNLTSPAIPRPQEAAGSNLWSNSVPHKTSPARLKPVTAGVWRTDVPPGTLFLHVARSLSKDYTVSQADRKTFSLQTDWDKFFIEGRLFHNRITVTIFPVGPGQTELTLRNYVEMLSADDRQSQNGELWLPVPDLTDEVPRILSAIEKTLLEESTLKN